MFGLPLQPIVLRCSSPVKLSYLNGLTLGEEELTVEANVALTERAFERLNN